MKYILLLLLSISPIYGQNADQILKRVDAAQKNFKSLSFSAKMEIESGSRRLSKDFYGVLDDGEDKSFMEYTNPQDNGTRYLKLQNDMWIYLPDAQDILKLSGHLLRDSMMGSDISYDDMLDQGTLSDRYDTQSLSSTNINGIDYYLLTIYAKEGKDITYIKQDLYVQKNNDLIFKVVMYAKGRKEERAIKEFESADYLKVGNIHFAQTVKVRDLRKKNSQTIITYSDLKLDIPIDPKMFTRAYLEQ